MADRLDHGEVAEAENLALTALGSIVHGSARRVSATAGIVQPTPVAAVIPGPRGSSRLADQVPLLLPGRRQRLPPPALHAIAVGLESMASDRWSGRE
jgi:hypothetical protein